MRTTRLAKMTAIAVASFSILAACGGGGGATGSDPGVTDNSILLGSHLPLTGPAAPGLQDLGPAWKAYFDYVNAKGGINGRDISIKYYDDGYNPTNTVQVVRKLVQQDKVFALLGGSGTATHSSVLDFLKANKVPDLFVSSGGTVFNQPTKYPNTFGWQPSGVVEGKVIAEYAKEKFAGKKVCAFGQDGAPGDTGVQGYEQVLGKNAYVLKQKYTATDPNIDPQIVKLRDAKCDVVTFYGISAFAALTMNAANKLGWSPTFIGFTTNNDYGTLAKLVSSPKLLEGFSAVNFLPPPSVADNSWNKLFESIWKKYGTSQPYGSFIEYGLSQAYTATQAIKSAGKDLTRQKLIDAVEANGFTDNPGYAPLRYSKTDHSGYAGGRISTVKNGAFVPDSDVYATTEGSSAVKKVTTAPAEAPASGIPN